MPIAYSPAFTWNVIAGLLLVLLGAVLALTAIVRWTRGEESTHGGAPPPAVRAFTAIGFGLFAIGVFWQLIGYLRMERAGW